MTTVMLECGHSFCSECTLKQLKQLIGRAEVEKVNCFDYACLKDISHEKLREILHSNGMVDLMEKF